MRHGWRLPLERDVRIFILLIILSVSIMVVDRLDEERSIAGQLGKVFVPFLGLSTKVMNYAFVNEQNHMLRERLIDISRENALLREQVHELTRLRGLLEFSAARPGTLRCARVIGGVEERLGGGIAIGVGADAGVEERMTVIACEGLVGRITKAGRGVSRVRRITDPGNRVSAMVQRRRVTGIVGTQVDRTLLMEWVAPDAEVDIGDTVISSGMGLVTPKGIPIGIVSGFRTRPDRFSRSLEIRPFVNFSRLEEVFVIMRKPPDIESMLGDKDS
jgi:rod shape-determining protein MreC